MWHTHSVPTQAVVYCRISSDPRGLGLGVERQATDCHALAARNGWTVTRTLTDNDVSAYSGKLRPRYQQLLDLVRTGQIQSIIAWHPDRLHRSPAELEEFIVLVERHGVAVETVQSGEWDLTSPSGRLMARQLGSIARYESEHKSVRVKRALEQNATSGRAHGRRAYGWTRAFDPETGVGREVVEPTEAAVVREIAQRINSGDSIRGVTTDLNDRAIPSPMGKPWGKNMVRHLVLRERNAGLRIHHGEVIGDGAWEPILDRAAYEQVRAVLRDPARKTSAGTAAKHLLSGIARCGVCGGPVRGGQNRQTAAYRCADGSCVARGREDVDQLVTAVVLGRLARPDAAQLLSQDTSAERVDAMREMDGLRARLDTAADDYADGKIDARQLERITARLRPQIDGAQARARLVDDSGLLDGLVANEQAAVVWESLSITRRRAVVDLLVSVVINRTTPGARMFDPTAVRIEWRSEV